jgi:flagellin-like hook-associated protein FlgL
MTRLQVMQQAGVAALAQAKGLNQSVVSLLN